MRITLFTLVLLVLFLLDAWSTAYLVQNFQGGELNPFIDTTSFRTILFSPAHFLVLAIMFSCLVYSEIKEANIHDYLQTASLKLAPFLLPIYFTITKSFAVLNNAMPLIGFHTPISYMRMPFGALSKDPFIQVILLMFVFALVFAPLIVYLAIKIYGGNSKQKEQVVRSTTN